MVRPRLAEAPRPRCGRAAAARRRHGRARPPPPPCAPCRRCHRTRRPGHAAARDLQRRATRQGWTPKFAALYAAVFGLPRSPGWRSARASGPALLHQGRHHARAEQEAPVSRSPAPSSRRPPPAPGAARSLPPPPGLVRAGTRRCSGACRVDEHPHHGITRRPTAALPLRPPPRSARGAPGRIRSAAISRSPPPPPHFLLVFRIRRRVASRAGHQTSAPCRRAPSPSRGHRAAVRLP